MRRLVEGNEMKKIVLLNLVFLLIFLKNLLYAQENNVSNDGFIYQRTFNLVSSVEDDLKQKKLNMTKVKKLYIIKMQL